MLKNIAGTDRPEFVRLHARKPMSASVHTYPYTQAHALTHARVHGNNGFLNAPQFYVISTLPVFLNVACQDLTENVGINEAVLLGLNVEYRLIFYAGNVNLFCHKISAIQKANMLF
jgi:hypothetical protein